MSTPAATYFDRAMNQLRDLGLVPERTDEKPIIALINRLVVLDEDKVVTIARTLSQASLFNEVVRGEVSSMQLGERYEKITDAFNSIRNDAKDMVAQVEDGKIDTFERIGNIWMKVTRGDIALRFNKIKDIYVDVAKDSSDQIERERRILTAYRDFRGALKESEILALDVLKKAESEWEAAKQRLGEAMAAVEAFGGKDLAERAKLELARDERVRELQEHEDRYQIAKDLADNLTVGYNTSEFIIARLLQTTSAKERVYKQAIMFFGTNETVLTALTASFTGLFGLHESTRTLEAMKEGTSKSLEDLAEIGAQVQEAAVRAGYGPTIRADAVKKLVESVVNFQARSTEIINEMRVLASKNAEEIRDSVEDGKQRMAALIRRGDTLPPPTGT